MQFIVKTRVRGAQSVQCSEGVSCTKSFGDTAGGPDLERPDDFARGRVHVRPIPARLRDARPRAGSSADKPRMSVLAAAGALSRVVSTAS